MTSEINDQTLVNLNGVKNRILGLLCHDLKEISYSHHLLSDKIKYLIDKGHSEEVMHLGEHIQSQADRFISIVEKLNAWIQAHKDITQTNYNSIQLDATILSALSEYVANSNHTIEALKLSDFNKVAQEIRNK